MNFTDNTTFNIQNFPVGEYVFSAQGTFGGGTLSVEWSIDGTNWTAFKYQDSALALTENGGYILTSPGHIGRVKLTGATSPNIKALVVPLR